MKTLIILAILAVSNGLELKGSQVLRIPPQETKLRSELLEKLQPQVDFWLSPSTHRPTDVHVDPLHLEIVKKFLSDNGFSYSVMIENVEALVSSQKTQSDLLNRQDGQMNWDDYQNYDVIMTYLDQVAEANPTLANVTNYGKSTLGRDLKVIKIGTPKPGKPALFLDGGMHAREWIGPAIVTYIVNELTQNPEVYRDILDAVDIYVTPIANPDGYEHSRVSQATRMWRKTRSDHNSIIGCLGVDPNRNFEYELGGPGTSSDKCSDIYKGPAPFSEPETQAMRDFIQNSLNEGVNWTSYYAIHSYAQMWLLPWGWTYDLPPTYEELRIFGEVGASALTDVFGTVYQVGSVTEILSPGAGGSDDWAYGSGIFRYSQTVEVRDTGAYGFLLPPEQIIDTAIETWAGIQATARFIAGNL